MPSDQHTVTEHRRPTTVVLVGDEQLIRTALWRLLTAAGLELVAGAANAKDAIELMLDLSPDVVLIGMLPGISGVPAIERLGLLDPALRILVLTR